MTCNGEVGGMGILELLANLGPSMAKPLAVAAGLIRDPSRSLVRELRQIDAVLSSSFEVHYVFVESDSKSPITDRVLNRIKNVLRNVEILRLGTLESSIPNRIERIAACRDAYMDAFEKMEAEYLVVFDTDGMNRKLSKAGFGSALELDDWAGLFANQGGPYYDIFALRSEGWVESDCFTAMDRLQRRGFNPELAHSVAVESKMLRIPVTNRPIEVDSAFGGLAIYKGAAVRGCRYSGAATSAGVCEHVSFNEGVRKGGRLLIVPSLVNANYTEHTFRLRKGIFGAITRSYWLRNALKKIVPVSCHEAIAKLLSKTLR